MAVMTAAACAHAERQAPAAELTTAFGADPQRLRLIAAVYTGGQVVAAATVGLAVTRAGVCDCAAAGCGNRGVEVDFTGFAGRPVPLPDVLAGAAAGLQATFTWLESGGIDAADWPYDVALNFLAACDINSCLRTCRRLGRSDLSVQDGIEGAWCILACRWQTVLQLSYRLASRGVLAGPGLRSCLTADPARHAAAASSYHEWRRRTRHLWQRCAATPSGRIHSAGAPG
jgi:hypothetical protein